MRSRLFSEMRRSTGIADHDSSKIDLTSVAGLILPETPGQGLDGADPNVPLRRRRKISPAAGRGLEIVGHAVDYLTDELHADGILASFKSERIQAIQLLMERNREIYFSCPVVPSLTERVLSLLRRFAEKGQPR